MDEAEDANLVGAGVQVRNWAMVAIVALCCDEAVSRVSLVKSSGLGDI